jgi:hypothetical protein
VDQGDQVGGRDGGLSFVEENLAFDFDAELSAAIARYEERFGDRDKRFRWTSMSAPMPNHLSMKPT